jgi:transcriptional antiterminator Rof (Rho-off)
MRRENVKIVKSSQERHIQDKEECVVISVQGNMFIECRMEHIHALTKLK